MATFSRSEWPVFEETLVCRPVSFSAGPSLFGGQQRRHLENARWRGSLKIAPLERDAVLSFRAFLTSLEGTRHWFWMPVCAPENVHYGAPASAANLVQDFQDAGTTTVELLPSVVGVENLRAGMRFSIDGFLHELKAAPEATKVLINGVEEDRWALSIFPPLRQELRPEHKFFFLPPYMRVRLADDASGVAPVLFGRQTGPITLNFEEVWER